MGFKDLLVFNDALLGKQAWRLVNGDDTLLGRVMKAKYYPKCSFLEASLGHDSSYSWKSVWSAKALVKEGMIWRVGNGANIHIWADSWVADESGKFITGEMVDGLEVVSDLVDIDIMERRF